MNWQEAETSRVGAMESQVLDLGEMICARHLIPAGFDSAPLYAGLPDDMCPCEHWCYLVSGELRYRFAEGEAIDAHAGEAFHVRGGHLADVLEDAELIEFTRAEDYRRKAEHLASKQVENPVTGERIVFLRTGAETDGELLEMDHFWTRPGHRTPAHIHPTMEERWEVIDGRVRFRIDGVEREAGPGDTIVAPAGAPHSSRSVGPGPVHLRIQMRPALRWQEFVERLFQLPQTGTDGAPDLRALATLLGEFPREIQVASDS